MSSEIEKLERRWMENPLGLTFAPLAEAYRKAGDFARALELLETGLAQHPNYVPAHIVRGRCHVDAQANAHAELAFRRVIELDPENVIALKGLADLAEGGGRLPEAIARLEALLDVDRNNEEARGQLDRLRELTLARASDEPEGAAPPAEPVAVAEAAPAPEYRLEDASASLHSDESRPEIVLHSVEAEDSLPVAEAAQGREALAEPDPQAATGRPSLEENGLPEVAEVPPPDSLYEEPLFPPEWQAAVEAEATAKATQAEPAQAEPESTQPEPAEPVSAEPETAELATAETEHHWAPEPEPEPEPELEPAAVPEEPELVVTETMAEIFLRQGHRTLALAVYSQLAQRDPGNERILTALLTLQAELAPPPPPRTEAPAAQAPRSYDAVSTGGVSVAARFAALLSAERPSVASAIHPPAFELPQRPRGEPTRPAPDALSLSSVFGEDSTPPGPAGAPLETSAGEPSFEQFFSHGDGSPSDIDLPRSPDSETPALSAMAPEDLEQFNAWLRGLKR